MPRIGIEDVQDYSNDYNGEWFKLQQDGQIARVQFMYSDISDLDIFAAHRVEVNGKERWVNCPRLHTDPIEYCPLCQQGFPTKVVRFIVMYQHDDNKVKIWERGKQFTDKIQSLMNRYSPLQNYVFEIERHGAPRDQKTTYEVFVMDQVQAYDLSQIEKPQILGGLVIDATPEDMEVYLQTGNFPVYNEDDSTEYSAPVPARRIAATPPEPAQRRSVPPPQAPIAPQPPRAQAPIAPPPVAPKAQAPTVARRGTANRAPAPATSARRAAVPDTEKF